MKISEAGLIHLDSGPAKYISDPKYCCHIKPSVRPAEQSRDEQLLWTLNLWIKQDHLYQVFETYKAAVEKANGVLSLYGIKRQIKE
jgi:hypothetical protein